MVSELKKINLVISEQAKHAISEEARRRPIAHPIPALLWAKSPEEKEFSLTVGFYDRSKVLRELQDGTVETGYLVIADGIEFFGFQAHKLAELDGKVLDYVDGKFSLIDK